MNSHSPSQDFAFLRTGSSVRLFGLCILKLFNDCLTGASAGLLCLSKNVRTISVDDEANGTEDGDVVVTTSSLWQSTCKWKDMVLENQGGRKMAFFHGFFLLSLYVGGQKITS